MIDGILEYPPGFLPMARAEALAEWIAPGWGHRELKRLLDIGVVQVLALRAPPYSAGTLIEMLEDSSEVEPHWSRPLSQTQLGVARLAAAHDTGPYSGWTEWFAYSLLVDHDALARRFDELFASTIASRDPTDRAMWTPPEALGWIASRDLAFVDSLRPQEWETAPKAWAHPFKRLIWRLARQDGTWCDLPSGGAPAARQAFDTLLAALRGHTERLAAFIQRDGHWQGAVPAVFAGAKFDPLATALDLASGCDLRFDARDVQQLWPIGGQGQPAKRRRGRPPQIDRADVRRRAAAELDRDPTMSVGKCALAIAADIGRDQRGIEKIIADMWQGK
ncbi:MAG TPA: hypothetical protein EYH41_15175 [Novosphingobium capsulatum]|nr:hypothetical protein [Novosphingobium capsulatum]